MTTSRLFALFFAAFILVGCASTDTKEVPDQPVEKLYGDAKIPSTKRNIKRLPICSTKSNANILIRNGRRKQN